MEAAEGGAEQSSKQAIPLRKSAEELLRGKGNVEEEADPGIRQPATQELGKEQKLVIVDPDEIARLVMLSDHFSELLVGFHVRLPITYVERHLVEQIMEERPE